MIIRHPASALTLPILMLLLTACGGGSGSSSASSDAGGGGNGSDTTPSPSPSPSPGSDDGVSASACFPEPLLTTGNVLVDTQRTTRNGETFENQSTVTVMGPDTFNNQGVIRVSGSFSTTGTDADTTGSFNFYFSHGPGPVVSTHGQITEQSGGLGAPSSSTTSTYIPPLLERYDLNPGESYNQTYELVSETTVSGTTSDSGQTVDLASTYVGRETITVPVGTLSTCRYEQTMTNTPEPIVIGDMVIPIPPTTSDITVWYGVGSGFPVRRVEVDGFGTTTNELLSLTINGVPWTQQ
jgi:hypothetical protein